MNQFKQLSTGTKVKIRKDLDHNARYLHWTGNDNGTAFDMLKYAGKEAKIVGQGNKGYKLDIDGADWNWTSAMLEFTAPPSPMVTLTRWDAIEILDRLNLVHYFNRDSLIIEKVLYNNKVTIIFAREAGTDKTIKLVAKLSDEDTFDLDKGLKVAVLKYAIRKLQKELRKI